MGARQSHLNIFLMNKGNEYEQEGCTIKPSKAVVDGSIEFEVVTYQIKYKGEAMNFDIYIYNTEQTVSDPSYIFAYCSPRIPTHVATHVKAYYSVLAPKMPLVISFHREKDHFDCPIDKLRSVGWDWASSISAHSSSSNNLVKLLKDQFKDLLWNRTMEFVVGGTTAKDVIGFEQELGDKNYRFIFVTKNSMSVIGSECLFSLDSSKGEPSCSEGKNPVDAYFLHPVTKVQYFDGIVVYFAMQDKPDGKPVKDYGNDTVLLLQFVDVRNSTILIKRKDKGGFWWSKESVPFKDDASVLTELEKIKSELKDVNTILLDEKKPYKGVKEVPSEDGIAFMKYTHKFENSKDSILLFERTTRQLGSTSLSIKPKHVEVYYLKAGITNDEKPFLIVFDPDGTGDRENIKAYHFNNKTDFKEWTEFTFKKGDQPLKGKELVDKLYEKVDKIKEYGGCTTELHLLKKLVYEIIIAKDEEKLPPRPTPPEQPRPDLYPEQQKPPEPLPLGWIITGSVGGAVFIIGSTVGYGIYWYNTTIRLLT